MTYKIKSLIYLSCFVLASILYYAAIESNSEVFTDRGKMKDTTLVAEYPAQNF
jgi:hypothetical protein